MNHINNTNDDNFDLTETIRHYLGYWKWILLSVILCTSIAVFYVKRATPVYESKATVLVKDDKQNALSSGLAIFQELGSLSGASSVQNEIEKLKSNALITSVVDSLRSRTSLFAEKTSNGKTISTKDIVNDLNKKLRFDADEKKSSLITLSIKGESVEKNNQILSELLAQHEAKTVTAKNTVSDLTSQFINGRLTVITDELSAVEDKSQSYKTQNRLTDIPMDVAQFMEKQSTIEQEITKTSIQLQLAKYINEYIQNQANSETLLPANIGFEDVSIAEMTKQYNTLVLTRNELIKSTSEKNPGVAKLEAQLASLKSGLVAGLKNTKATLELQLKSLQTKEQTYGAKLAQIPEYERTYRDIARQQQIKETLYLYLLQKREENEIARTATIGNIEVVDPPYSNEIPVSPKKSVIVIIAFFLGFMLPIGVIYCIQLFDTKLRTKKELMPLGIPYLGDIPNAKFSNPLAIQNDARSSISEAIRIVRTNLNFLFKTENPGAKTVFITSSVAGEGKSFIAINLAHSLAVTGKKVAVLGLDLRSPRLSEYVNLQYDKGITNLLVDSNMDPKSIKQTSDHGVDYFFSGPIPPNPSELLTQSRLDSVVMDLKQAYDFLIVDTAPTALVVDTLSISHLADATIYVCRANHLPKKLLPFIQETYTEQKFKNMALVLNGSSPKKGTLGYGYGYGN